MSEPSAKFKCAFGAASPTKDSFHVFNKFRCFKVPGKNLPVPETFWATISFGSSCSPLAVTDGGLAFALVCDTAADFSGSVMVVKMVKLTT